jgi:branched-subunit amino acid aminotransferase/4-amino-4-deoxychorismate lyase
MHRFVSFNFQILPAEKSILSAISSATFYGKGIFTTLAVFNSRPFLWSKHWHRLQDNANRLNIDLSEFPEQTVLRAIDALLNKNKTQNARVRLTFFDESGSYGWLSGNAPQTSFLITTADFRPPKELFCLKVSPFFVNSKSPLRNIKSCNYLENLLAFEEAAASGFDEAIRLNEQNQIVSATMANVFWVKNSKIFTPNMETGCLSGTTRQFLLENFEIFEVQSGPDELAAADEIFLTSAGIGVQPAVLANSERQKFPITQSIQLAVCEAREKF